jgi:hypothetical protein
MPFRDLSRYEIGKYREVLSGGIISNWEKRSRKR